MDANDDSGMRQVERLANYRTRAEELRRMADRMREESAQVIRSAAAGYDQMADTVQGMLQRPAGAAVS